MRIDRRSALIGTASIALGLGTSQARAQISVGQAAAAGRRCDACRA